MATVALAEAKARLSELVRLAGTGETVTITSRGKPVARIVAEELPKKRKLDVAALRTVAAQSEYQHESAGDFMARVRESGEI